MSVKIFSGCSINVDLVCTFQLSLFLEKNNRNEKKQLLFKTEKCSWHLSCFENRVSFTVHTMKDREVADDLLTDYYDFFTIDSFLLSYNILMVNTSL